jgi:hypothetical protein
VVLGYMESGARQMTSRFMAHPRSESAHMR